MYKRFNKSVDPSSLNDIEKLRAYIIEFGHFVDENMKNISWFDRTLNKPIIIKGLTNMTSSLIQNTDFIPDLFLISFELFSKLVCPKMDHDIRNEAYNSALKFLIHGLISNLKVVQGFFDSAFDLELKNKNNIEILKRQCQSLFQIIRDEKELIRFLFWLKILDQVIFPKFFGTEDIPTSIKKFISLDFLTLLSESVQKFGRDNVFNQNFSCIMIGHLSDVFETLVPKGVNLYQEFCSSSDFVSVIYEFLKNIFPCKFNICKEYSDQFPDAYLLALYYNVKNDYESILLSLEKQDISFFYHLFNICFSLIYYFIKEMENNTKEYEQIRNKFFMHVLRVKTLFEEVMKIDEVKSQKLLFLNRYFVEQEFPEMYPLMIVLYTSILLDDINTINIDMKKSNDFTVNVENYSLLIRKSKEYDEMNNQDLTFNIMEIISSQLAVLFSELLFKIQNKNMKGFPALYEYKNIQNSTLHINSKNVYFLNFSNHSDWNTIKISKFLEALFAHCDKNVEFKISSSFTKTLLEISKSHSVSTEFCSNTLLPIIVKIMEKQPNKATLKTIHSLIKNAIHFNHINRDMSLDWIMILKDSLENPLLRTKSIYYSIDAFLDLIPFSLSLTPFLLNTICGSTGISDISNKTFLLYNSFISSLILLFTVKNYQNNKQILPIYTEGNHKFSLETEMHYSIELFKYIFLSCESLKRDCMENLSYLLFFGMLFYNSDIITGILDFFNSFVARINDKMILFITNLTILPQYLDLISKRIPNLFFDIIKRIKVIIMDCSIEIFKKLINFVFELMVNTNDQKLFNSCAEIVSTKSFTKEQNDYVLKNIDFFFMNFRKENSNIRFDTFAKCTWLYNSKRIYLYTNEKDFINMKSSNLYGSSEYKIIPQYNFDNINCSKIISSLLESSSMEDTVKAEDSSGITDFIKRKTLEINIFFPEVTPTKFFHEFYSEIVKIHHTRYDIRFSILKCPPEEKSVYIVWLNNSSNLSKQYYLNMFDKENYFIIVQEKINGLFYVEIINNSSEIYGLLPERSIIPKNMLSFSVGWTSVIASIKIKE